MKSFVAISFLVAVAAASAPCDWAPRTYRGDLGTVEVAQPLISAPAVETVVESGSAPLVSQGLVSSAAVNAAAVNTAAVLPRSFAARNYRVALDNCGPKARRVPTVAAPSVTAAPVQGPTVTLPYNVPSPRTVSNSCRCVKTIVKPQPIEQIIRVPVIRRFVQTLSRPTYETINYEAEPINCPIIEGYACY